VHAQQQSAAPAAPHTLQPGLPPTAALPCHICITICVELLVVLSGCATRPVCMAKRRHCLLARPIKMVAAAPRSCHPGCDPQLGADCSDPATCCSGGCNGGCKLWHVMPARHRCPAVCALLHTLAVLELWGTLIKTWHTPYVKGLCNYCNLSTV
jgi:hypothetical protein